MSHPWCLWLALVSLEGIAHHVQGRGGHIRSEVVANIPPMVSRPAETRSGEISHLRYPGSAEAMLGEELGRTSYLWCPGPAVAILGEE
jgi:hypothetical protein